VYKSTDAGFTWTAMNNGIAKQGLFRKTYPTISTIIITPSDPSALYVGTFDEGGFGTTIGRFYRSNDGGQTWTDARGTRNIFGVFQLNGGILTCDVSPTDAESVYAGVSGQGVFRSNDGGRHWTSIRQAGAGSDVLYHIVRTAAASHLFVAGGQRFLGVGCIPIPHKDGPLDCTGVLPVGPLESFDGGLNWAPIVLPETVFISDLQVNRSQPEKIYFSTIAAGLVAGPVPLLINNKGIFKSVDGGITWVKVNTGLPSDLSRFQTSKIVLDPAQPSRLLIIAKSSELYQSLNEGNQWLRFSVPMDVTTITGLAIGTNHFVYISSPQGLYVRTSL
jgi:hypothetical protein